MADFKTLDADGFRVSKHYTGRLVEEDLEPIPSLDETLRKWREQYLGFARADLPSDARKTWLQDLIHYRPTGRRPKWIMKLESDESLRLARLLDAAEVIGAIEDLQKDLAAGDIEAAVAAALVVGTWSERLSLRMTNEPIVEQSLLRRNQARKRAAMERFFQAFDSLKCRKKTTRVIKAAKLARVCEKAGWNYLTERNQQA